MERMDKNLLVVVREELLRLGVQGSNSEGQNEIKRSIFHQNGSKLLGFTTNNLIKQKIGSLYDSPKSEKNSSNHFILEGSKSPKTENKTKKAISKSPFSTKNRIERKSGRKKKGWNSGNKLDETPNNVFGCELESMELCSTHLHDGTLVSVPEFIVDASNLIQKNVSLEGIFRKAGSAQRQNEIKKLLKSGKSLPLSVHPIDVACLLKQFLRSLPIPLLSHHIHFLMTRCLELPKEEQQEALGLCSLLLSKPHQDLLGYILELFSTVASASKENLMDAHNLAIVLAPNLLPNSKGNTGKKSYWTTEDHLLSSTIDVLQALIEGANGMCRLSKKLAVAVQNREKSQSVENLAEVPASGNQKKKRRSASLHRLVNGLRRVVQGGGGLLSSQTPAAAASPVKSGPTPPILQDRPSTVSMDPDVDTKPLEKPPKRKSDTFEPPQDREEEKRLNCAPVEFDRPKKKAKIEVKSRSESNFIQESSAKEHDYRNVKNRKAVKSLVTVHKRTPESVKRRYSLRERKELEHCGPSFSRGGNFVERRNSFVAVPSNKSRSRILLSHALNSNPNRKSISPSARLRKKTIENFNMRKSNQNARTNKNFKNGSDWYVHRPVGSEQDILGARGIPDGAESNLRVSPLVKSSPSDPIRSLEKRYDEIKSVVQCMEEEVDRNNLKDLKDTYFSNQTSSEFSSMSCSQLIHDAYERMKMETKDLDCSPSETLSRRLGRELKIRSRRSDEYRVLRSPSERRIGIIRRRSKELEQNNAKMQQNDDILPAKVFTPKFKGHLLQSPQVGLKRGKPNSLRSGLPVVVKPSSSVNIPEPQDTKLTPPKTVCISKRRLSSRNSSNLTDSTGGFFVSPIENLSGCSVAQYSGPITRRRSSIISTVSNPHSPFNLRSAENSFDLSFKSLSGMEAKVSQDSESDQSSFSRGCTVLLSSSGKDLSEGESEWMSATKFMQDFNIKDNSRTTPCVELSGNRPSIVELRKKKKVTANFQLFSQLQDHVGLSSPTTSRRSSRYKRTPSSHPSLRGVNSQSQNSRIRIVERSPSTPMEFRRMSRSKFRDSKCSHSPQVAVVSPLKEKNHFGSTSDMAVSTPKIMSKARRVSKVKRIDTFIVPSGLTPLPPRPYKPSHFLTPKMTPKSFETLPKIPSRSSALFSRKPSPVRNYR